MNFVTVKAQEATEALYEVAINADHLNYVVPSSDGQVGRSIISMAMRSEVQGKRTVAVMDDIVAMRVKFPDLTSVEVYSTARGTPIGSALVNMARVMLVRGNRTFFVLQFVDGDELLVAESPI